jgi:hypothetical protein
MTCPTDALPAVSCLIDGEMVCCDANGLPVFGRGTRLDLSQSSLYSHGTQFHRMTPWLFPAPTNAAMSATANEVQLLHWREVPVSRAMKHPVSSPHSRMNMARARTPSRPGLSAARIFRVQRFLGQLCGQTLAVVDQGEEPGEAGDAAVR